MLAGLDGLMAEHAGKTVVVVSHVTPIKTLVAKALDAPLQSVFRMELSPASVSVVTFYAESTAAPARRCGSTTPDRRATTRSRPPHRPGDPVE